MAQGHSCAFSVSLRIVNRSRFPVDIPAGSSLRAKFNGVEVSAVVVGERARLRRIALVIDNSASMADFHSVIAAGAAQLIQQSPRDTQIALIGFANLTETLQTFSTDKTELLRKLDNYHQQEPAKGHTALLDAIRQAVFLFGSPQAGDVVIAITDGGENASKSRERDVKEALEAFHTPIFFLIAMTDPRLGGVPLDFEAINGLSTLDTIAEDSGGANFLLTPADWSGNVHPELLAPHIGLLLNLAGRYYEVAVNAPAFSRNHGGLKIELLNAKGRKTDAYTLLYPHSLPACLAAQTSPTHN
jgi:hypothetical protein